jgi:hypothetical protein
MNGHNPLTQFYITINLGNVDSTITQTRLCIITCVSLTPTVKCNCLSVLIEIYSISRPPSLVCEDADRISVNPMGPFITVLSVLVRRPRR